MENLNIPDLKAKISKCIRNLIKFNDLGFVLNNLENCLIPPTPYKVHPMTSEEYIQEKEKALSNFELAYTTYNKMSDELNFRENTFSSIRSIYPDFCADIKNSLTPEQIVEYNNLLKKINVALIQVNQVYKKYPEFSCSELYLQQKDIISSIIDSEIASKLGYFEDNFVLTELDKLDMSKFDSITQKNIDEIRNILVARIKKFEEYSNLYNAKKIVITGQER